MDEFEKMLKIIEEYADDNCHTTMPKIVDKLEDQFSKQCDDVESPFVKYFVLQHERAHEGGVYEFYGQCALEMENGKFIVWSFVMEA